MNPKTTIKKTYRYGTRKAELTVEETKRKFPNVMINFEPTYLYFS